MTRRNEPDRYFVYIYRSLRGRRIERVSIQQDVSKHEPPWFSMELDDGRVFTVASDPEMNGPGVLLPVEANVQRR